MENYKTKKSTHRQLHTDPRPRFRRTAAEWAQRMADQYDRDQADKLGFDMAREERIDAALGVSF